MGIAEDLCVVFLAALVCGLLARVARVPMVLGYILAGVLLSPHTPGPQVIQIESLEQMAEVGVALLMFGIGLEFPLPRLAALKGVALFGTALQMGLTIVLGWGVGRLIGLDNIPGIWLGVALSLSSTMVALKYLGEQGLQNTLAGRVMLAMLVVQDLAIIPLMILLPDLGDLSHGLSALGGMVWKAGLIVAILLLLGGRLLPVFFSLVARYCPRELFTISVIAIGLGVGYLTYRFGLSFAFGAFLAGLVLSESDLSHHVMSEVGPFRDLFGMLFFVSVGLLIDPVAVGREWPAVTVLVICALLGKALIFAFVTRLFGYGNIVPFAVGLTLCQVGEFSFVLAHEGVQAGAIDEEDYNLILATAVITMVATPFTARLAPRLYAWYRRVRPTPLLDTVIPPPDPLHDHVLIGGFGRVGRLLAEFLHALDRKFVVVELDPDAAGSARQRGYQVVMGDLAQPAILEGASLHGARLAVITVTDFHAANRAVQAIRKDRPDLPILARAVNMRHVAELAQLQVEEIVQPEMEAGLQLVSHALMRLGIETDQAVDMTDRMRHYLYTHTVPDLRSALQGSPTSPANPLPDADGVGDHRAGGEEGEAREDPPGGGPEPGAKVDA